MNEQQPVSLKLEQAFKYIFHGKYLFADFCGAPVLEEYEISQNHGRNIYKPSEKLKKYLRFLNSFVFNYASINNSVVHSYRKGKNTLTALEPHRDSKHFFLADIKHFFDNITADDVARLLGEKTAASPISDLARYKDRILELTTVDGILPIGFPSSPPITNSHLLEFDNALENHCIETNAIYTRYSDDLIISSNNREILSSIENKIGDCLRLYLGEGYLLKENKTKFLNRGKKINILGLSLLPNGRISVGKNVKAHIEPLLYFYINDKKRYEDCLKKHFDGKVEVLAGRLRYLRSIDPDYMEKLRKKYGAFVVDSFYNLTIG